MKCKLSSLKVLAYADGFTLWLYKSKPDALSDVMSPGYFADVSDLLLPGDVVFVSSERGAEMAAVEGTGRRIRLKSMSAPTDEVIISVGAGSPLVLENVERETPKPSDAYILTASGGRFYYEKPEASTYGIRDIAFALSGISRFTGHARRPHGFPYTVAQHCVLAVSALPPHLRTPRVALAVLLHDASEAFMSDIASPLKRLLPDYKAIEKRVQDSIYRHFGVEMDADLQAHVTSVDLIMLATEKRDLMPHDCVPWPILDGVEALQVELSPWSSRGAEVMFMNCYEAIRRMAPGR